MLSSPKHQAPGGYEAVDSMIYYGQPGPFAESVEEKIFDAIRRVLRGVGASARGPMGLRPGRAAHATPAR